MMIEFIVPAVLMLALFVHAVVAHRPTKRNILYSPWFVIACVLSLPTFHSSVLGHESLYFELYQGKDWMEGSTLTYPSMQIWWKLWGLIFMHSNWGMNAVLLLTASLCIHLYYLILYRTTNSQVTAIIGSILLLLHAEFASWMGHMYNIIPPLMCALYSQLLITKGKERERYFGATALSLAILMRLEYILLLPFFLVQVAEKRSLRPIILGSVACILGIMPILSEVPGEGERLLSFFINFPIMNYWNPALWIVIPVLLISKDKRSLFIGLYVFILHLIFCTFNDYGTRHTLFPMPIIIWILCSRREPLTLIAFSAALFWGRFERQSKYEASEEDFAQYIEQQLPNLPRLTIEQAKADSCAWISEEEPFQSIPTRSHFNLYHPQEEQQLRKEYGCIQWCSTKEDWRWSPLGVNERAIRLHALYAMEPISIVVHNESQCILYKVGTRKR